MDAALCVALASTTTFTFTSREMLGVGVSCSIIFLTYMIKSVLSSAGRAHMTREPTPPPR